MLENTNTVGLSSNKPSKFVHSTEMPIAVTTFIHVFIWSERSKIFKGIGILFWRKPG